MDAFLHFWLPRYRVCRLATQTSPKDALTQVSTYAYPEKHPENGKRKTGYNSVIRQHLDMVPWRAPLSCTSLQLLSAQLAYLSYLFLLFRGLLAFRDL